MAKPKKLTAKEAKLIDHDSFIDKFKPKLTTDDCYTPPLVFEAVADYVQKAFAVPRGKMIRPFWHGADYKAADYSCGAVVVDNPPFSILSEIIDFYTERGIKFFLFAPGLTVFNYTTRDGVTAVVCGAKVVYENGADVNTSFLHNFTPNLVAITAPDLAVAINDAIREIAKAKTKELPRYNYPSTVVTAAKLKAASCFDIKIERSRAHHLRVLDNQRPLKKSVFGSGYLVPLEVGAAIDEAIKNRVRVEREAGLILDWELSPRELEIIKKL